jgi:hypothetical protein
MQVFVLKDSEVGAFRIYDLSSFWKCIKQRWGNVQEKLRLTPKFDGQNDGASYFLIPRVQGGKIDPMTELLPRIRWWYQEES